jgi:hypothetical protein
MIRARKIDIGSMSREFLQDKSVLEGRKILTHVVHALEIPPNPGGWIAMIETIPSVFATVSAAIEDLAKIEVLR